MLLINSVPVHQEIHTDIHIAEAKGKKRWVNSRILETVSILTGSEPLMASPRFILSPEQLSVPLVYLTGDDFHHCRVLRLKPGESVRLCDGQGREYLAQLKRFLPDRVEVELESELRRDTESPLRVTLYQGLARGDKLDWTIQKATEIGLARFVPMITERSQVKPQEGGGQRLKRWQEIARQAVRQSERVRVPEIALPLTFDQALAEAGKADLALMLFEAADPSQTWKAYRSGRTGIRDVAVLVGPEGGFSVREAELAEAAGIHPVSLGPRILRSETAGLVAVAMALCEWGDLGGGRP